MSDERLSDEQLCNSCGCELDGELEDHRCHGCGIYVCPPCCDVFDHLGAGLHGTGNPHEEVRRLRRQRALLLEALEPFASTFKFHDGGVRATRDIEIEDFHRAAAAVEECKR